MNGKGTIDGEDAMVKTNKKYLYYIRII